MSLRTESGLSYFLPTIFYSPLFIVTILLTVFYYWQQSTRKFRLGNAIPGPWPKPFIGNAMDIITTRNPYEIMSQILKKSEPFENLAKIWLGPRLIVALYHPDDVEVILNSNVHLKKSPDYEFFEPWLGDGLLTSYGDKWRSHRKMIAPTFHMNILKSFMGVFNKNSRNVVEALRKEVGSVFDVHDYMSGTTVDILLETAMGITKNERNKAGYDYAMAVMKLCEIIHLRQFRFYLRNEFMFQMSKYGKLQKKFINVIHGLTKQVVKERKEDYSQRKLAGDTQTLLEKVTQDVEESERKEEIRKQKNSASAAAFKGIRDDLDEIDENDIGQKKRLAFLDFMIESSFNSKNINDTDIKEEVDTIMFEGHDTTAAGSSFVLCMLGVHQDVQKNVMQELNDIFGDSDRQCTFNDTVDMKYLERVILETLRLYPPVPFIAREVTEDVKIVTDNLVIPANSTVIIAQYKVHRRPDVFPNPTVFDPDNFLPERCQNRHYYGYFPFSAGPRSCVGRKYALLKLKVLISTILRNYHIVSEVPEKDFKLQGDIILKRADGFRIRIEPRKK